MKVFHLSGKHKYESQQSNLSEKHVVVDFWIGKMKQRMDYNWSWKTGAEEHLSEYH